MISPNLHDIWAMFFLILSRYEKLVLLMLLGLQVMAILCRAAKNSLRGTDWFYSPSLYGLGGRTGSTHHLLMVEIVGLALLTISLWFGQ